ncbi:tripartite tricarboxylate transporter TctB family protein [Pseudooctadecabacter jejudonensis]|uniref:Tripartite tricarboxylate transporter TctB family protein n=1 Tax=Pseudooctadecabacter jejudonensis TaxID=1391910 RepID=A0A1Y5RAR9_9RHOB|nr:tripartite tricarboxylate transporter TctB family protein [Pseudooctadecabacter jejudonensis]SLN13059.1 Tripartite tricarboxylate transporter TctB family protein [Pseudooctadecabacter jejudonensis]
MQKTLDIVLASAFLLAGLGLLSMTFGEAFDIRTFGGDVGPAFAPRLFLAAWSVFAAVALMSALRSTPGDMDRINMTQFLTVIVIATVTALAMTRIGFVFAAVPGLAAFCWAFGYRRIGVLAIISVTVPVSIWALFTFGFELLLPRSPWFYQI